MTGFPVKGGLTSALASHISSVEFGRLPGSTQRNIRVFLLDYVASVHAGYRANRATNEKVRGLVLAGPENGRSRVFFARCRAMPQNAGFINAFYAHGADMDDGNKLAAGHIGAHVISALMALAEDRNARFEDFYSAMASGYEAYCRLSSACMPFMVDRGFHSTGMAGALASAAACARLLGLGPSGVSDAMSLSATQASGLLLVGESRQEVKPLNPANAARTGIFSALLAERGVRGPLGPLESDKGWLHAMTPVVDADRLLGGLGERYSIDGSYLKPYPSCRHTHCAIEAAVGLRRRVAADEIESVDVVTYGHAIELAGGIEVPRSPGEAKFSIKYAVSIALSRGGFSLGDLDPGAATDGELSLIRRTRIIRDDSYERPDRGIRGAKVAITTKAGSVLEKEVLVPKGDPENPFTDADIEAKLRQCFSDENGEPYPEGAEAFLQWYRPMMADARCGFVFPEIARVR